MDPMKDGEGRSALHLACEAGHPFLVEQLVKAGAAIGLRDRLHTFNVFLFASYLLACEKRSINQKD